MKMKVQLKTKSDLLSMGYENNSDPNDFLNLLAGKQVTLDLDKTYRAECGGIIYQSIEYQDYAIYDYLVKRVIQKKNIANIEEEFTLKEIGANFGITMQRADQILKAAFKKINKYIKSNNLKFEDGELWF